jgi:ribosomal protein S15P/S13E
MPKKNIKKEEQKKLSQEEFENKVIELAKTGLTAEKIGENLRNQGLHPREYNKKISQILKEKNLYIIPEIKNLEAKLERISIHYSKNKQDKRAMRERERILSQIRKIKKYHRLV